MDLYERSRALFPDSQVHYRAPRARIRALRALNREDPFLDHLGLVPHPKGSFKALLPRNRGRFEHHQLAPQLHYTFYGDARVRRPEFHVLRP